MDEDAYVITDEMLDGVGGGEGGAGGGGGGGGGEGGGGGGGEGGGGPYVTYNLAVLTLN